MFQEQKHLQYNTKLLDALFQRKIICEPELPTDAEQFSVEQLEVRIPQLNQVSYSVGVYMAQLEKLMLFLL